MLDRIELFWNRIFGQTWHWQSIGCGSENLKLNNSIDIPAVFFIDEINIVLFAGVGRGIEFPPCGGLRRAIGWGIEDAEAPCHRIFGDGRVEIIEQFLIAPLHEFVVGILHGAGFGKKWSVCG